MLILLCTLVYIFFVFTDLIPLYNNKSNKLFWTYSTLLLASYFLLLLLVNKIKIPSPAEPIKNAVIGIFDLSE